MPLPVDLVEGKRFVELYESLVEHHTNQTTVPDELTDSICQFMRDTTQITFVVALWIKLTVDRKVMFRALPQVHEIVAIPMMGDENGRLSQELIDYMHQRTRDNPVNYAVELYGSEKTKAEFEKALEVHLRYNASVVKQPVVS